MSHSNIAIIYDGDCDFCRTSIDWLALKLEFTALAFQRADLQSFGLTRDECAKEVIAIADGVIYRGAGAVAFLLDARGNRYGAWAIR